MKEDWQQVEDLFFRALEHDPVTRTQFLRDSCDERLSLYEEVATLLRSHEEAGSFIERPAAACSAELVSDLVDGLHPGEAVGSHTILSLIGSGGMGEVYLAEDNDLGRRVALKLVKRGYGTAEIIRQFRREERILAGLTHPNIARLYGGGVTADGLPYFIMEYVEGDRLDDYCELHLLTISQRLELFRKVCAAVSYAHQRLIIHRDLKPANVRVTADGEPKLLDFGIAKLLGADSAASSEGTITGFNAMTTDYASPEQIFGEPITTATDIYSLGVILYQLLTGTKPFDFDNRAPEAIAHAVRTQEPTRPSSAAARLGGQLHAGKGLRGDLDTITLMALRKETARRYPTVERFSDDIRRYLEGRPVIARKDTISYRAGKFIRRNRIGVTAGLLVLLSMIGGIVATSWQARMARQEKTKAQSVNAFLEDMISYSNPYLDSLRKDGRTATMTELLDAAAQRLTEKDFAQQPEIRAELERIIAISYNGQGRPRLGEDHMQNYISLASQLYPSNDPRRLPASADRAYLLFSHGELAPAEKAYRQVLPQLREAYAKRTFPIDELVVALNNFGYLRRTQGDSKEAESVFRETISLSSQLPKGTHFITGVTRGTLASTLADGGNFQEALRTANDAVLKEQQAGRSDTPSYGFTLTILGGFLTETGDFPKADAALAEGERLFRRLLGPAHLWLGDNLRNQAISFYRQDRFGEAEAKVTEALSIYNESFGPHYDQYPTALITKGLILNRTGDSQKGEAVLREALKLRMDSLPKNHFWVAEAEEALGQCLLSQGRLDAAEALLLEAHAKLAATFGRDDPRTRAALKPLLSLYQASGRTSEAALLQ
ncbi:MAG: tetratricopeptide repeat protein [Verrucomicrobiota bacterium]|nr:tetratricopeptide repeat protein [Verrucomicrobiota bacterium]